MEVPVLPLVIISTLRRLVSRQLLEWMEWKENGFVNQVCVDLLPENFEVGTWEPVRVSDEYIEEYIIKEIA